MTLCKDFENKSNYLKSNGIEDVIPCDENSRPFFTACSSGCLTVLVTVYPGPNSYYRKPTQSEFDSWRDAEQANCKHNLSLLE